MKLLTGEENIHITAIHLLYFCVILDRYTSVLSIKVIQLNLFEKETLKILVKLHTIHIQMLSPYFKL